MVDFYRQMGKIALFFRFSVPIPVMYVQAARSPFDGLRVTLAIRLCISGAGGKTHSSPLSYVHAFLHEGILP